MYIISNLHCHNNFLLLFSPDKKREPYMNQIRQFLNNLASQGADVLGGVGAGILYTGAATAGILLLGGNIAVIAGFGALFGLTSTVFASTRTPLWDAFKGIVTGAGVAGGAAALIAGGTFTMGFAGGALAFGGTAAMGTAFMYAGKLIGERTAETGLPPSRGPVLSNLACLATGLALLSGAYHYKTELRELPAIREIYNNVSAAHRPAVTAVPVPVRAASSLRPGA
jgi:hypothetical protein